MIAPATHMFFFYLLEQEFGRNAPVYNFVGNGLLFIHLHFARSHRDQYDDSVRCGADNVDVTSPNV